MFYLTMKYFRFQCLIKKIFPLHNITISIDIQLTGSKSNLSMPGESNGTRWTEIAKNGLQKWTQKSNPRINHGFRKQDC